jgi:hypothetical protein
MKISDIIVLLAEKISNQGDETYEESVEASIKYCLENLI